MKGLGRVVKMPEDDSLLGNDRSDNGEGRSDRIMHMFASIGGFLRRNLKSILILLLLLGGVAALIVYFVVVHDSDGAEDSRICLAPSCVTASSEILQNMSPRYQEIDPCTDFDQYVCDGFNEQHDLRPDQGSLFTATLMAERGEQILRHLLEAPHAEVETFMTMSSADHSIFEKLQAAYAACLDEDRLKQIGSEPLIALLWKVYALFPIEKSSRQANGLGHQLQEPQHTLSAEDEDYLTQAITFLTKLEISALIDIDVGPDDKDPDTVVPMVGAPRAPGLRSKEYYEDEEILAEYAEVIYQVFEGIHHAVNATAPLVLPESSSSQRGLVDHLVNFEHKLARVTPATEEAEDVTFYYNPMTFDEAKELLPQISLESIVKTLAPQAPKPPKIIVAAPSYLKALASILKETSEETLRAYAIWKTVQRYSNKVEADAVKPLKRFNNKLSGKEPDATPERWRTCVQVADNSLGWILSRFFVQKAFSEEARLFGDKIVSDIKDQFVQRLQQVSWMSEDVKKLGIQKVHAIVQKVGYPIKSPDIRNASELLEYYSPVDISKSSYFDNSLSISKFDIVREWSALGKPTDRAEWGMTADTVNAYYNPPGNEIVFPAGIMQKPVFYDPSVPQYLTYGAFGAVSGHELSHAFDSLGRHYDEKGNYTDWWDDATVQAFEKKAQCFVDQYAEYTVPNPHGKDLHVNGRLTLGENIADAGGLNAAFKAWHASEKKEGESELLPGLQSFSKEQVFFISYANWWCGKARPETAVERVYRDPHAPTWARILGTMANSRDFRKAFNCPVKEPTCELW